MPPWRRRGPLKHHGGEAEPQLIHVHHILKECVHEKDQRDLRGGQKAVRIMPLEKTALLDLIPLEELQQLQDSLAGIGSVKSVITDPEGYPLTMPSNDISICRLIRQSVKGEADCLEHLHSLSAKIKREPRVVVRRCESIGILKAAVPIVVQGQHLGNWWISQYCAEETDREQIVEYAKRIGLDARKVLHELEIYPRSSRTDFEKALAWIDHLAQRITHLGYQNHVLARDLSKMQTIENELDQYKAKLEDLVQERTVDLIQANKFLQLEALERDLVEEQVARKSKMLDAMNQILHQTLSDRSEKALAMTCLHVTQELTGSPFGFVVERQDTRWRIMAELDLEERNVGPRGSSEMELFDLSGIWRQVVQTGESIILEKPVGESQSSYMPAHFPKLKTLMTVPLSSESGVSGFLAVANNPRGYALVDRSDAETLARAFTEALLRKRSEQAKHLSEKRLNLALDSADEGLWDYFPQNDQIYYSPRWFSMLGYKAGELPYSFETWTTLTHPEDLPVLAGTVENVAKGGEDSFRIEIRMLTQAGQWRWVQVRGRTVERDDRGDVLRLVGTLIDISKYKQVELALQKANEELQRLAALDGLTQIANRRRFDERLADEWRRARRDGTPLGLVLCDIDFFKRYNDTYGHVRGDDTLYAVAQAISASLKRPMDMVARYGGEEFAIVLPNTDLAGAVRVAREVQTAIQSLNIEHKASTTEAHISLSYGVAAMVPEGSAPGKSLIELADRTLYQAKGRGRNQIVQANEPE